MFLDGFVVTPRKFRTEPVKGRPGRLRDGFTLHRTDCHHAHRAGERLPAPAEWYPDTVECPQCRPTNPHRYRYAQGSDGRWVGTCSECAITGEGQSQRSAGAAIERRHNDAASKVALAEARAKLAPGEQLLVLTPRWHGSEGLWTLHRESCAYLKRAKQIWPAPDQPRPGTQECTLCAPHAKHHNVYTAEDGGIRASCPCGHDTGVRPSEPAARNKILRLHREQPDGPGVV